MASQPSQGCAAIVVGGLLLMSIGMCSTTPSTTSPGASAAAVSSPAYVAARTLNCRAAAAADSTILASLRRAERVVIVQNSDGWSKIERPGGDCWVSMAFLSDSASGTVQADTATGTRVSGSSSGASAGYAAAGAAVAAHKANSGKRRSRSARFPRSRDQGLYGGGTCLCSGRNVCIGPRGGRYCITSGGNKRYGV